MDLATSGKGGIGTYIGICFISGAFGVADAHVQGGMVGDLSYMLPEFIQVGICHQQVLTLFLLGIVLILEQMKLSCFLDPSVFPCWFRYLGSSDLWPEVDYEGSI